MTIKQKAERAFSALHQAEYAKGNDIEDAVCDLLADLIHLSKDYNFTVAEVLERAQVHAEAEQKEPT